VISQYPEAGSSLAQNTIVIVSPGATKSILDESHVRTLPLIFEGVHTKAAWDKLGGVLDADIVHEPDRSKVYPVGMVSTMEPLIADAPLLKIRIVICPPHVVQKLLEIETDPSIKSGWVRIETLSLVVSCAGTLEQQP
jgi:hypothetical protein